MPREIPLPLSWPQLEYQNHRPIAKVYWPDSMMAKGRMLEAGADLSMSMFTERMGDRTFASWIICRNGNGIEIARHNALMVETIVWVKPAEAAG